MLLELSRSRSVACQAHILALAQELALMLDFLVRTAKNEGAVGTSTRAEACAFTGDPQPLFEFTSL